MAKLIIFEESDSTDTIFETYDLITSRVLIGSASDNHLILQAPNIDPTHASLELRDNSWVLQDLGGPGGTGVNGREIEGPYYLHHDDLIELNQIKMRFLEYEQVPQAEPSPPPGDIQQAEAHMSGRVWFTAVAGGTVAIIFVILFLLIVADYLELIQMMDLVPPWLTDP